MTIVVAASPRSEDAAALATDLRSALAALPGPVRVAEDPAHERPDVLHLIANTFEDIAEFAPLRPAYGPKTTFVVTVLRAEAEPAVRVPPDMTYAVLTHAAAEALRALAVPDRRVHTLPLAVPCSSATPASGTTTADPYVAVLAPAGASEDLIRDAIQTVPELPSRTGIVVACQHSSAATASLPAFVASVSRAAGVSARVFAVPITCEAELTEVISSAVAAVATSDRYGGLWHGLRPLALGVPMLAPDRPLFREAMLDGAGIRLTRETERGHLSACLRAVLGNPVGLAEMRERGRAYAVRHTYQALARRVLDVYLADQCGVP